MSNHLKLRIVKKNFRYWVEEKVWFWWNRYNNDGFNTEEDADSYIRNMANNIYKSYTDREDVCKEYLIVKGIIV